MKIFKIIPIFSFIILNILFVNNCISGENHNNNQLMKELECSLSDLDVAVDILEIWNSKYKNNSEFGEKIKQLILTKMLLLRIISPDLTMIKWDQLESIHRLIVFIKKNGFSIKKIDDTCRLATSYLYSIENRVNSILKNRANKRKQLSEDVQQRLKRCKRGSDQAN